MLKVSLLHNSTIDCKQVIAVTGTVKSVGDTEILVHFTEKGIKLRLDPSVLIKLNKFSIHQIVRIRSDRQTIREIESDFGITCRDLVDNKVNF